MILPGCHDVEEQRGVAQQNQNPQNPTNDKRFDQSSYFTKPKRKKSACGWEVVAFHEDEEKEMDKMRVVQPSNP